LCVVQTSLSFSRKWGDFFKMSIFSQIGELFADLRKKMLTLRKKSSFSRKGQIFSRIFLQSSSYGVSRRIAMSGQYIYIICFIRKRTWLFVCFNFVSSILLYNYILIVLYSSLSNLPYMSALSIFLQNLYFNAQILTL